MTTWNPLDMETSYAYPAISQAVIVDPGVRQLWISGQVGWDPEGNVVGDDSHLQAEAAFENISRILRVAGGDWSHVAVVHIYAVSEEAWIAAREVRERYLVQPRPASTMVIVQRLADPRLLVEIEVMAALPSVKPTPHEKEGI